MKYATAHAKLFASVSFLAVAGCSSAASQPDEPIAATASVAAQGSYLPDPNRKYPERVLWGDQHLHTGWSMDAGVSGATLTPEDAVRFARGEMVKSNTKQDAKLERPLDWVAVTDHSDGMGTIGELKGGNPEFMADPRVKRWHDMMGQGIAQATAATLELVRAQATRTMPAVIMDEKWVASAWQKTVDIMEKYNEPGKFTAFIAYEWTSNANTGENLHRNVIFRGNADTTRSLTPLTTWESGDPATLWAWLDNYASTTGGKVLAIPHNGNLSNGRMFEEQQYDGKPLTNAWVEARARWEPVLEIYQYKGLSEAHPSLSPTDEFAGGELWDTGNLAGIAKQPGMYSTEYWREALKSGLRLQNTFGTNPFKLGAAAGTDSHTGLSAADENAFWGKLVSSEPSPDRWDHLFAKEQKYVRKDWTLTAAGHMGVWAVANTREAIWDAMKRRETYATTGPRITLRFFGGYDFGAADARADRVVPTGYAKGVPMGGDLQTARSGQIPTFLIAAMKDPIGANLDRAQVVKGWVDSAGKAHERIYEVAWSDPAKRKLTGGGKIPAVGDTVDLTTATYKNSIGASTLIGRFRDPNFDPKQRAFYYVRVLAIPTPRWTAYDAVKYKVKMSPEVPMKHQERAASSPIWYNPA